MFKIESPIDDQEHELTPQEALEPLRPPESPCKVTVMMSTRNRAESLDSTVALIAKQRLRDGEFEVIVADNGSHDETPEVLKKWSNSGLRLQSFVEPIPGKNRALNRGLQLANGELIVFTDDDVIPDPDWLQSIVDASERWPDDAVFGGPIIPKFPEGGPSFLRDPDFRWGALAFARLDLKLPEGPMQRKPFGPNLTIRRFVFERFRYLEGIGPAGDSYAMGDEIELLGRLSRAGFRTIFVPAARVQHVIRPEQIELGWLKGRAFRGGRGAAVLYRDGEHAVLFGAPRWLWKALFFAVVARIVSFVRSEEIRWSAAMELQLCRGKIFEFRRRARLDSAAVSGHCATESSGPIA